LLGIIIFLSSCTTLQAIKIVNSGEVVHGVNKKSIIPFEINGHPILIKVRLNNSHKEYKFVFDTGALTVISQRVAKELKLQNGIKVDAHGTGGKAETVNLVKLNNVIVGNAEVKNTAAIVVDFSDKFRPDIGGILGSNFLRFFQVTIDYQKKEISLLSATKSITQTDDEIKIFFETDIKQGFAPKIKCVVDGEIEGTGLIDTGFPGIADLPLSMMERTKSFQKDTVLTANGGMTGGLFGMTDKSYLIRVDTLEMGNLKFTNVPTMSHSLKGENVLFGNKFLSKFLVTINYPAGELVLKPTTTFFETNILSYGLGFAKKDKKTIVSGVWDNSSASWSKIKLGDEIVKVNSKATNTLPLYELMALFMDEKVNDIEIMFIRNNREHKTRLHKKMLLPALKNNR